MKRQVERLLDYPELTSTVDPIKESELEFCPPAIDLGRDEKKDLRKKPEYSRGTRRRMRRFIQGQRRHIRILNGWDPDTGEYIFHGKLTVAGRLTPKLHSHSKGTWIERSPGRIYIPRRLVVVEAYKNHQSDGFMEGYPKDGQLELEEPGRGVSFVESVNPQWQKPTIGLSCPQIAKLYPLP